MALDNKNKYSEYLKLNIDKKGIVKLKKMILCWRLFFLKEEDKEI